jgi:hypothetical protein
MVAAARTGAGVGTGTETGDGGGYTPNGDTTPDAVTGTTAGDDCNLCNCK